MRRSLLSRAVQFVFSLLAVCAHTLCQDGCPALVAQVGDPNSLDISNFNAYILPEDFPGKAAMLPVPDLADQSRSTGARSCSVR